MSPAKVRYKLQNLRTTPSSSRPSYTVDDSDESEDELSARKSSSGVKNTGKMVKGKRVEKKNGQLPFKALPTPVKSSQIEEMGNMALGMC